MVYRPHQKRVIHNSHETVSHLFQSLDRAKITLALPLPSRLGIEVYLKRFIDLTENGVTLTSYRIVFLEHKPLNP